MKMDFKLLDPTTVRDLRPEVLGEDGRLRVLPTSYWQTTTVPERALLGHRTGLYSFPTVELVAKLQALIAGRVAIEIGAGHGVLADALGIPGTDNFQQRKPKYRRVYEQGKQAIVPYGPNVIEMDAARAIRYYRPEVVIGCWVTHLYDPKAPERGGNEIGVDERDLLKHCSTYLFVGNEGVHQHKPIWDQPHTIDYPAYVVSRAANGGRDFLATFGR